ncbi:endonuclease domain-containing protein [Candidatus Parcubacteria bacterium]|nr:endonuclease domain-containing protein [Candidatus Parcubacteria bacterium]
MATQTQSALVGIVPRKELWPIIQKEKWYHIPVKSAPENISFIKYLAFYFPECFIEKYRHKIIYYAEVLDINTVKRTQLFPKEPEHERAQENYYQLRLGQINKLPQIIPCKRMIIHVPTNRQKLFTSKEINDLWDISPLEEKMHQALKKQRIAAERQLYVKKDNKRYFLDFAIFCHNGKIDVECDGEEYHSLPDALAKDKERNNQLVNLGWQVLRFSGQNITHNIKNCIAIVEKTIDNLGGLYDIDLS